MDFARDALGDFYTGGFGEVAGCSGVSAVGGAWGWRGLEREGRGVVCWSGDLKIVLGAENRV